ncbi:hypothetical protein [Calothrix sp. PCC 6303]|uniref:hypothetical protein n=1 Tax=Calothrix sp. PCC 6303 TaxID=1170562 RepID=UPI0002A00BE2|nr:hypothetical protein [Calothrix sp. PCC 6303]AFY99793.1 hypothetical protein Cal6303_0724 [Calothrix sp. PCC 6303]
MDTVQYIVAKNNTRIHKNIVKTVIGYQRTATTVSVGNLTLLHETLEYSTEEQTRWGTLM